MLSLKGMTISKPKKMIQICDLPEELLYCIVLHLYSDSGCFVRSITPLSTTCRSMRRVALPFLFETFTISMGRKCQQQDVVTQRTLDILDHLAKHAEVASCIRHLRAPMQLQSRTKPMIRFRLVQDSPEMQSASDAFKNMTALRRISVECFDSLVWTFLDRSRKFSQAPLHLTIHGCKLPPDRHSDAINQTVRADSYLHGTNQSWLSLLFQPNVGDQGDSKQESNTTCDSRPLAIFPVGTRTIQTMLQTPNSVEIWSSIQELHLSQLACPTQPGTRLERVVDVLPGLKRLAVEGCDYTLAVLEIVDKLSNLEGLRLHTTVDRVYHQHLRSGDKQNLPYLDLPNLKCLEVRYISRYLETQRIIPPNIRSLRLEYLVRAERVTPFDLRWMAQHLKELEILQLNIGNLDNLWHPTAIAGVDVDVEVYQLMSALGGFKKLRKLRLFPTYWKPNRHYLDRIQPVSDEQAVRIFRHLSRQCRRLETLYISTTTADYNQGTSRTNSEKPTKWIVRSFGEKTVLTTYQACKDYELEQIWEGERRLTMRTIRHQSAKRYFDDLDDWTLPSCEFDFDEPLASIVT